MSFKPQDFSRFLIREFLKKSGFDATYDSFMKEDTRERVTMTKNELTKLLGIDQLMKRNSKNKSYETMLDIICDFFVIMKETSNPIVLPQGFSPVKQDHHKPSNAGHKKTNSGAKKAAPPKTQQNWFGQGPTNDLTEGVSKKHDKEEDDWDLDAGISGKKEETKVASNNFMKNEKPAASKGYSIPQRPNDIKKPVGRVKKESTMDNDIDDLDDLMGGGLSNVQEQKGKNDGMMRDTLGFLKKAEQEKKKREEQKLFQKNEEQSLYKGIENLSYKLSGYQAETDFDYNLGPNLPPNVRQQISYWTREEPISVAESNEIRRLLHKNPNGNFLDSWHQGFFFDKKLSYGIYQKDGGPCGVLASVQAFFLKHLLYVSQQGLQNVPLDKRDNYVAAAITDILLNSSDDRKNNIVLAVSGANPKQILTPSQCQKVVLQTSDPKQVFYVVKDNIGQFTKPDGQGVVLLVYSVLLTKGTQNILNDMDVKDNSLLTEHGYAAQELINVILVGRACSNVFDGERDLGDNYIIKGIHKDSEIGFLTLFEAYGYFQVGKCLKNPKVPIWIVCSESHYSVLFSTDYTLIKQRQSVFDLVYYDELAKQEDDIVLTVKVGMYKGPTNLQETNEMIPPIDAVIRTKWDHGLVSWNGRQAIL